MAPPHVLIDPTSARQFAVEVVRRLRAAGHEALWAGGCVRDQLLFGQPADYDVATSALPEQVRAVFGARRTLALGAAFGVITVLGAKEAGHVEVATFRRDAGYSDGRRPDSVAFSNAEEDAQRRDFTINGLFYDPFAEQVIDYVGGVADLERRIVRAIGDPHARFSEDKLRMLRGVRFAATFGFAMDNTTQQAIRDQAAEVVVVSAERIAAEMRRMLVHENRSTALHWLEDTGLLAVVLAELAALESVVRGRASALAAALPAPAFATVLAVLLRERYASQPDVADVVGQRWRLSNEETGLCAWLLKHERVALDAHNLPWRIIQPLLIEPGAHELVKYLRAIETMTNTVSPAADFCAAKLALPQAELNPPPLVTGADLQAMGLKPGPGFKVLLGAIRAAQLEGRITDRAAALLLARELAT